MRAWRRRRRGESGAVAVEAALVMPLLCLLIFGMVEFSFLLRDYVSVTAANRAGGRVAATGAAAGDCISDASDATKCPVAIHTVPAFAQNTAEAMNRSLTGVPRDSINYVLIFEANKNGFPCTNAATCNPDLTPTGQTADNNTTMPSSCTGYVNCVMFTWNATKGAFRYASGTWDSRTIAACVNKQDSVGVFLRATHQWQTGLFGSSVPVNDRGVSKFEPLSDDSCDSTKIAKHG
ncbi:MAG: pilus assembly protein [Nocardioidaceae bacterium]|nr:pilus assembly protein [Nocardioidaceae bacterium]